MTLTDDIHKQLEEDHNVLLYHEDIYSFYSQYKIKQRWVYISSPSKGKRAIETILNTVEPEYKIKNESVARLLDEISAIDDKIVIFIDNFEHVNRRTLEYYTDLINMKNIYKYRGGKANEDREFIDMSLLENFVILNYEIHPFSHENSISIRFTVLFILSVLIFLLFLRVQLSIIGYLVSGLWFAFLMYRSFYYMSR